MSPTFSLNHMKERHVHKAGMAKINKCLLQVVAEGDGCTIVSNFLC